MSVREKPWAECVGGVCTMVPKDESKKEKRKGLESIAGFFPQAGCTLRAPRPLGLCQAAAFTTFFLCLISFYGFTTFSLVGDD